MDILNRIEQLRKEKNWSVNYLAMEAGLTQSTLNNLYSRKSEPKISTLRSICNAFNISLSDFFYEENEDDIENILIRKIKGLSTENQKAVIQIINNLK